MRTPAAAGYHYGKASHPSGERRLHPAQVCESPRGLDPSAAEETGGGKKLKIKHSSVREKVLKI